MRILNNDPTTLEGSDREKITVTVTSTGTVEQVAYSLNEKSWAGGVFQLDPNQANPYELVVEVGYSQNSDGAYKVVLTGSLGGTSTVTLQQAPGQADDAVSYTVDVKKGV